MRIDAITGVRVRAPQAKSDAYDGRRGDQRAVRRNHSRRRLLAQRGLDAAERTRFGERRLRLEPGAQGQRPEREELTGVLRMLFSVTLIVLMIACANVSNRVIARVDFRTADIMVRLSLGASRMQLVRFLLIESSLLAAMGSVGGLIVASWALDALTSLLPGDWAALHFQADAAIIVFAVVLCIAMSLTIGVYPALRVREEISCRDSSRPPRLVRRTSPPVSGMRWRPRRLPSRSVC